MESQALDERPLFIAIQFCLTILLILSTLFYGCGFAAMWTSDTVSELREGGAFMRADEHDELLSDGTIASAGVIPPLLAARISGPSS